MFVFNTVLIEVQGQLHCIISYSALLCVSINKANLFLRNDAIPKQKFDVILMSLLSIVEHRGALEKISKKSILL